jgi:hypothetical protein
MRGQMGQIDRLSARRRVERRSLRSSAFEVTSHELLCQANGRYGVLKTSTRRSQMRLSAPPSTHPAVLPDLLKGGVRRGSWYSLFGRRVRKAFDLSSVRLRIRLTGSLEVLLRPRPARGYRRLAAEMPWT